VEPSALALGDMDQDGDLDLVIGAEGSVTVALNNGEGELSIGASAPLEHAPFQVALADLDQDGDLDIISNSLFENDAQLEFSKSLSFVFNDNGTLSAESKLLLNGRISGIAVGDVDQDGDKDIAALSNDPISFDEAKPKVFVLLNNGVPLISKAARQSG